MPHTGEINREQVKNHRGQTSPGAVRQGRKTLRGGGETPVRECKASGS